MNITKRGAVLLSTLGLIGGIAGTVALQTHAADTSTTTATATTAAADVTGTATTQPKRPQGHAPLGGDGNITAISGNTITMQEEANEGGASYTVDASSATVTSNGAASTLSALKVGDKVFVQGTTNGTTVTATSVSLGHPGFRGHGPEATPDATTGSTTVQ